MATITDSDGWVPVTRPETTDIALGGNETNFPGKFFRELASRDRYLYETALGGDATSIASAVAFRQLGIAAVAQGRLTLQSGVPVSTTDQTAKTVLYYTPYNGDYVALYNTVNTRWDLYQFTERSLNLSGLAANTNYDIFIYNISGTLVLQPVAWATSGAGTSTRASSISQLNGIWVKDSDKRRLLGTIRTTSTTGQCEDSVLRRYVWNTQNKATRTMVIKDTVTHTYEGGVWRYWNNDTTIKLGVICGLPHNVFAFSAAHVAGTNAQLDVFLNDSGIGAGTFADGINGAQMPVAFDGITLSFSRFYNILEGFNTLPLYEFSAPGGTTTDYFFAAKVEAFYEC